MTKHLQLIIKVAFSLILLILLISNSEISSAISVAMKFDYKYILFCVLIYLIGQFVSAHRWKLLSDLLGFNFSTWEYYKFYLIGMYFNLFLPSTIGGDVTKAYYLVEGNAKPKSKYLSATYSILADRMVGLIVLVWIACMGLLLPVGTHYHPVLKYTFMLGVLMTLFLLPIMPILVKPLPMKYKDHLRRFLGELKVFWKNPLVIFQTVLWSLLFHGGMLIIHVLIGTAMDLHLPFSFYMIAYPVVSIISFIPISFNGIGVREGLYIYFFGKMGIDSHVALVFSIFYFAVTVLASITGGYVYLKTRAIQPVLQKE